jgi:hypothetical protein
VFTPGIFFRRGSNSVEDRGQRERGSGVPLNLKMNETRILIRLLWMYIPRNWEFCSALSKRRNFGGFETPPPPGGMPLVTEYGRLDIPSIILTKCTLFVYYISISGGRDREVGTAARYGSGPGIDSRWGRDFPAVSRDNRYSLLDLDLSAAYSRNLLNFVRV